MLRINGQQRVRSSRGDKSHAAKGAIASRCCCAEHSVRIQTLPPLGVVDGLADGMEVGVARRLGWRGAGAGVRGWGLGLGVLGVGLTGFPYAYSGYPYAYDYPFAYAGYPYGPYYGGCYQWRRAPFAWGRWSRIWVCG